MTFNPYFERGAADYHYHRPRNYENLTDDQINEYDKGYDWAEKNDLRKDWE